MIPITYREEVDQLVFSAYENCSLALGAYQEVICCYGDKLHFLAGLLNVNNSGV